MVAIAAQGGLRYGELTELRRGDLILNEDIILMNVTRAVTKVNGSFRVGPPKSSAGVRVVALPPQITATVLDHLKQHVGPGDDALLFPARGGGHLGESSFVKHWYPARAAAGREDMPWHALRHYSITRYARAGATPKENMIRHAQVTASVNMDYQHATGRDAALAARMMATN